MVQGVDGWGWVGCGVRGGVRVLGGGGRGGEEEGQYRVSDSI